MREESGLEERLLLRRKDGKLRIVLRGALEARPHPEGGKKK